MGIEERMALIPSECVASGHVKKAYFRFYAELNDLLPLPRRGEAFSCSFETVESVKDAIEAIGIPHTEVDLILANGEPVPFSYLLRDGDRISVYPVFREIHLSPEARLQPRSEGEIRFVLDTHLGKLAAYLRMLGFDSLYRNDCQDAELAQISASQQRTLLSRDRGLLKRSAVTRGYLVREAQPQRQLIEVLCRFELSGSIAPFRRCLHCNALLQGVSKDLISDRLPPRTRKHYEEFHACPDCNRLYWKGSHYQRMAGLIERVIDSLNRSCLEHPDH
jgi:uncharacterized protein with PIN domain